MEKVWVFGWKIIIVLYLSLKILQKTKKTWIKKLLYNEKKQHKMNQKKKKTSKNVSVTTTTKNNKNPKQNKKNKKKKHQLK